MDSLDKIKSDYTQQINSLSKVSGRKESKNCIFVGSGDSYVAGLIAEYFSNHKCKCYSPSDFTRSEFMENMTYYFISVTGRTRSNIEVAKRATRAGVKTVAVTFDPTSELANVCEQIYPLETTMTNTSTSYSAFTANVVICLQLAGVSIAQKFNTWHKNGLALSSSFDHVSFPNGVLHILGNDVYYPLAIYASLKMAEFFGVTAIPNKMEEFCHSPVFGIKPSHTIWILGRTKDTTSRKLENLKNESSFFELKNPDLLSELFESIFFLQGFMLLLCEKRHFTELKYVLMKKVLAISSDIIYRDAT
jgi:glucosamine 6-phosphate synthetase-like amidotransferase/phosphosugar isomerase protein